MLSYTTPAEVLDVKRAVSIVEKLEHIFINRTAALNSIIKITGADAGY